MIQHSSNLYAANGAAVVFAEKGHFDVSKDIFTQVSVMSDLTFKIKGTNFYLLELIQLFTL
jgi:hypothetical protein